MSKEEEIKRHFICELTNKIMTDPVSIDGPHYFERDALMDYIKDTGMTPVTKQKISTDDITEEPELKDKIQSLCNLDVNLFVFMVLVRTFSLFMFLLFLTKGYLRDNP